MLTIVLKRFMRESWGYWLEFRVVSRPQGHSMAYSSSRAKFGQFGDSADSDGH